MTPDDEGEFVLLVSTDYDFHSDRGLRRSTLEELNSLLSSLKRWMPNDFSVVFFFEAGRFKALIAYMDGSHSGATTEFPFAFDANLRRNLRGVDWETMRVEAIQGLQKNDEIIHGHRLYEDGILIRDARP